MIHFLMDCMHNFLYFLGIGTPESTSPIIEQNLEGSISPNLEGSICPNLITNNTGSISPNLEGSICPNLITNNTGSNISPNLEGSICPNLITNDTDSQLVEQTSDLENKKNIIKDIQETSKSIDIELQTVLDYTKEYNLLFEQIELILDDLDSGPLNVLLEKRKNLICELEYLREIQANEVSFLYSNCNKFGLKSSDLHYLLNPDTENKIVKLVIESQTNDSRIDKLQRIIFDAREKLDDLKIIWQAESPRNSLLAKDLLEFKKELANHLKMASSELPNMKFNADIFHQNLDYYNTRIYMRNQHLFQLRNIIRDHYSFVKRVRSQREKDFYYKETQTLEFSKSVLKNMKKLNTKLQFGLAEVLEFESRSEHNATFFASRIKFSKFYYGPEYSDFENITLKSKYKEYCKVDTLKKFFDLTYSDIEMNAKSDQTLLLHSFFVFRSSLLRTIEDRLSPHNLYSLIDDSNLCYKTIQEIFDLNKKHIDYFYKTYYSALNHGEEVTDSKLKAFENRFFQILGEQSMIWLRQYMHQVYGVTDFAWEH